MKKLTVEYLDYRLEIEIHSEFYKGMALIKGTCKNLCFNFSRYCGNYHEVIYEFMQAVDKEESGIPVEMG